MIWYFPVNKGLEFKIKGILAIFVLASLLSSSLLWVRSQMRCEWKRRGIFQRRLSEGTNPKISAIHRKLQLGKENQISCSDWLVTFLVFLWHFTGKKLPLNFWLGMFCVSTGVPNPFRAGRKQFYELTFTSPSDKLPLSTMKTQVTLIFTGQGQTLRSCPPSYPSNAQSFLLSTRKLRGTTQLKNHFLVIQRLSLFV